MKKRFTCAVLLVGGITACMSPARAQDAAETGAAPNGPSDQLEEITVTAQRRSENIDRVPVTITAVSADRLEKSNISTSADLGLVTPGLNYTVATGYAAPFLRGIGNNNATPGSESAVATYVDGVYYGSPSATVFALAGVSQIEVLKGPQGTLFGRNATGGVIQVRTRDPEEEVTGSASLGYGNYQTVEAKAYLAGGFTDALAASIAGYYQDQAQGYGRNLTTGNDTNKAENLALRGKLSWQLGPATSAMLALDYEAMKTSIGVAWRPFSGSTTLLGTKFTGGREDIISNLDPYIVDRQGGASLTVRHDFGAVTLLSISAYRKESLRQLFDVDYGLPVDFLTAAGTTRVDQQSQEFQLQSPASDRLSWTAGLYFYRQSSRYRPLEVSGLAVAPLDRLIVRSDQRILSAALFGQARYEIADATRLTLGARYTIEERRLDQTEGATAGGVDLGLLAADGGKKTFRSPTWRIALDQDLADGVMGYLSYSRGFKSGQFNAGSFPATPVKPETVDAYEVGLKANALGRRLRFNNSFFYYNYRDMQIPAYNGTVLQLRNAATAHIYGWDSDVEFLPTPSLHLTAGLELLHATYSSFPNAVISTPAPAGGNIITNGSASGNRVMLAPKFTAFATADWQVPVDFAKIDIDVTYAYNDGWFSDPDNRLHQDGYSQVNASLTWALPGDKLSITLWVRNLTDEIFAQWSSSSPAFTDVYTASAPRTFGGRIGLNF